MILELLLVLALILLNGLFSMAELAVVSSRRGRLEEMAEAGSRGARAALALADAPGRFLSTVQFGITLVGVLAGAFSGARFADPLGERLDGLVPHPEEVAFALVVAMITYASIVVGELVPKQFALRHAEAIAVLVARPMALLSRLAHPVVWLLDVSAGLGLRLLGQHRVADQTVSEEEVRRLIAEGTRSGVFAPAEKEMIDRVMSLADRPISAVMTPRVDVEWIDAATPVAEQWAKLRASRHSRLPLCRGRVDEVIGIIQAKDVIDRAGQALGEFAHPAAIVPETADALQVIDVLRASPTDLVLVVDEYGAFEGLVTETDLLAFIAGAARAAEGEEPGVALRDDGTLLVDASLGIDEARLQLGLPPLPAGSYNTLAGFALAQMRHLPVAGESFDWEGWRFEVVDMDGRRIDKFLVTRPVPEDGA